MVRLLLPLIMTAGVFPMIALAVDTAQTLPSLSAETHVRPVAEPAAPLTLQAALALALDHHPELSASRNEWRAATAAVHQAAARPNPTLEWTMEDQRRERRETTVLWNQPLELGGKREARIQAAEHGREAASAEWRGKRAEVRASAITAFFEVLMAQERLRVAEESTRLAQQATDATARRVVAGKISPVETTRARVAESGVRLELTQARTELSSARRRLTAMWGNLVPRFERAEGELANLPALPERASLSGRLATAPALARAKAELARREALARLESRRRVPDLNVSLGVKRSEELGRNQAIVGVSVPLPIFDSNRGNALEAARRADKARDEVAAVQLRLDDDFAQAIACLELARNEAAAIRDDILPGAQDAYEAAVKGFEFGKFGFLEVLDAQRTLLQARSQYLRALSEAHRAAAYIDRLLGEPPPTTQP